MVPDKILVRPFVFENAVLRVDRSGESLKKFQYDAQEKMTRHLVSRLSKHVAPAEAIAATAPLPRGNIWLVEGRIDRMHQGSRLARSLVGFGLGGTKMEVTAVVYDLSGRRPQPFLVVQTSGGSNAAPGAIGSAGFFVSGVTALTALGNLIEGLRTGLTFDTIRTAKEITATTSEFLYQQRAIPHEKALAPKRLGQWSPDFWPFSRRPEKLPEGSLTVTPAVDASSN
ncbi:MAG: hypothetical protein Fur0032_10160 [Terrimicrobiaceae bacterium]